MFSIDYPHEITLFGSTQQVLAELTQGLEPNVKHAMLAGNAMQGLQPARRPGSTASPAKRGGGGALSY